MRELSVCGVCCSTDCKAWHSECAGCIELGGRIPWAAFYGREFCPIFQCVAERGFTSCADCGQAPCDTWNATRNPDASDEEFAADIASRLKNLGNRS